MKRNILYILNDNGLGGATLSLLDTLTEIRKYIKPVIILQESIDDEVSGKFEELGICCYKIQFSTDYVKIGHATEEKKENEFRQSYEAALQLLPIIKQENIALIHINSSVSYFAALAALMADVPYVWHIRELMEEQFSSEFLDAELKCTLYSYADKLITISNFVRQKYKEKFLLDTACIYDGVDRKRFKVDIEADRDYENIFLVAAAVVSEEKGQLDAIKAVETLIDKGYSDIKLIIAGGGDENYIWALKKYIKKQKLESNIYILPFCYDLADLRKRAPYAITCSQNEALGRVTVESMLAGEFVIGAESGGTVEIIGKNEERGILYELHNSDDLAEAMIRAMRTPRKEKLEIVKSAQTYAEKEFDSKKYCNEIMQIYDMTLNSFTTKKGVDFLEKQKKRYELVKEKKELNNQIVSDNQVFKLQSAFTISVKWIELKQKGYHMAEYFNQRHIESIAIYGMALLGQRLYDELEDSDIKIRYLIDRQPDAMSSVLEFVTLSEKKLEVDAIVVTVAAAERQIVEEIRSMGYRNVIGLSDVLESFY